ncbi:MAG: helicase HerA-like domain-containing protein [Candidatus Thorarchaeota archaeon]
MTENNFFIGVKEKDNSNYEIPSILLTTHTVVLGASGSGKTVVCKSIVEEALFNGVPVIAVDPKGDIGGLGISFGDFDFDDENIKIHINIEAEDRGKSTEELTNELFELYQEQLAKNYGKDEYKNFVKKYSSAVLPVLITPKNPAGLQLTSIPDFEKPKNYVKMLKEAPDAVLSALDLKISLLLRRCGINAESSTDNNIVFINHLIRYSWENQRKKTVTLEDLIDGISKPPFDKIGAITVERFLKKKARDEMVSRINALMVRAVPGIKLDFDLIIDKAKKLNKAPLIVFDLRKITEEEEKSLFVAEILESIQRWIWKKGGSSQLRALLYFDELYGFMPAGSVKPPSKTALLLLLKQARAGGLGCLLATQNPGDLDYRGLSNIATWFLGRLTSNQDIQKVEAALKAVFEGSGGSSDDFKQLMSSMRALKPGEFISYSPKLGVDKIKTRWLLSYHKGPLVEKEIKHLNKQVNEFVQELMPAQGKKQQEADEEFENELSEQGEEASEVMISIKTSGKKPAIEKSEERYIKKVIPIDKGEILNLLKKRLGLFEEETFNIDILSMESYYNPLLYFSIQLDMKKQIEIDDTEKIPVEINQSIERVYDLSYADIQWENTSVEGIYPSALGPIDLNPIPDQEINKYLILPKDLIKIISGQIIWTLSQSPILEAKEIFYTSLDKYEKSSVQKLGGKNKTQIGKLADQISKFQKQLTDIESKNKILYTKLETVEADKINRQRENRSTRAQERSIESVNNQIEKLNEKFDEIKQKIMDLNSERNELNIENKEQLNNLMNNIGNLRSLGPTGDLFRASKNDLKLTEQIIFWIPRLLVTFVLKKSSDDFTEPTTISLNLVNGNGVIHCQSCNPKLSEQDYWESLLATEISPPIFVCFECMSLNCSIHAKDCQYCEKMLCSEHANKCKLCDNISCADHAKRCSSCDEFACQDHYWSCHEDGALFCMDENAIECSLCTEKSCSQHNGNLFFDECLICKKTGHKDHFIHCGSCKKYYCNEHMKECNKCHQPTCPNCANIFSAGNVTVIKCKNCL